MKPLRRPLAFGIVFGWLAVTAMSVGGGFAAAAEVPDPSTMLSLVPAAAQAGPPPCIKPGTRLTYYGMSASVPGSYQEAVLDENGNWVLKGTGQRIGTRDIPGASGSGYNVVQVGTIGDGVVQVSSRLYTIDTTTQTCMYSMGSGMVTNAGCASDFWIHPDALKDVQAVNANGVRIVRMPYTVGGTQYNAIRLQNESASGYNAYVYDLETGLMIFHGSRAAGKSVVTPPMGGNLGLGAGSTQLVTGWIMEVKDVDVPWKDAPTPDWVGRFGQLSYSGAQTTMMPMAGSRLDRPMTVTVTPKARGDNWLRFVTQGVIQSVMGMPPEQTQEDGACGAATIGGMWISPQVLKNLRPQQVIDRNEIVGTTTTVGNVRPGFVTLSEVGARHRIDTTYNTRTGVMAANSIAQQIGMATTTHSIQLVNGP